MLGGLHLKSHSKPNSARQGCSWQLAHRFWSRGLTDADAATFGNVVSACEKVHLLVHLKSKSWPWFAKEMMGIGQYRESQSWSVLHMSQEKTCAACDVKWMTWEGGLWRIGPRWSFHGCDLKIDMEVSEKGDTANTICFNTRIIEWLGRIGVPPWLWKPPYPRVKKFFWFSQGYVLVILQFQFWDTAIFAHHGRKRLHWCQRTLALHNKRELRHQSCKVATGC